MSVIVTTGNKSQNALSPFLVWQSHTPSINKTSANSQKFGNETGAEFKEQAPLDPWGIRNNCHRLKLKSGQHLVSN
ncbi:MAG: hypothetical protein H0U27_06495 [Nitrosopumilus sp.]|nr:hypothetical protein [Nitrosopumilus sp.]